MRERPILFSAPMVRALLDGTKTQTRRVVKKAPQDASGVERQVAAPTCIDLAPGTPFWRFYLDDGPAILSAGFVCPYGGPGDRLWVRESFWACNQTGAFKWYVNDIFTPDKKRDNCRLVPSIHMARRLSRITLEITDVRVQHVAEISEEDATAEGCKVRPSGTWWQGYKDLGPEHGGLLHQQYKGENPPEWMIEPHKMNPTPWLDRTARDAFRILWEQINPGTWAPNPWVWAVTFKRIDPVLSPTGVDS